MPPLTTDDRKLRLRVWGQENDFDPCPNLWSLNRYLIAGKLELGIWTKARSAVSFMKTYGENLQLLKIQANSKRKQFV